MKQVLRRSKRTGYQHRTQDIRKGQQRIGDEDEEGGKNRNVQNQSSLWNVGDAECRERRAKQLKDDKND